MSQMPEKIYLNKDCKYSTLDFYIAYDICSEELDGNIAENYVEYIPSYRHKEAMQQLISKALEWIKKNISYDDCGGEMEWVIPFSSNDELIDDFVKFMGDKT